MQMRRSYRCGDCSRDFGKEDDEDGEEEDVVDSDPAVAPSPRAIEDAVETVKV